MGQIGDSSPSTRRLPGVRGCWIAALTIAIATRLSIALFGPALNGYDPISHVAYVFFLDLYRAIPFADQGWSHFHPPLHYAIGWLLAQSGSPEFFARGLAVWGSAASLGIGLLAAAIVRMGIPGRPWLPLLAFVGLALLPVHLYAGAMPGNEMTGVLLGTAALASHLANQQRRDPSLGGDARTGVLAGLALLTKYSAAIALIAIVAAIALRALRPGLEAPRRGRLLGRIAVISIVTALVCGGYYARNLREFGTPLPMSDERPMVTSFEGTQPPGERSLADLVTISPRLFVDPNPRAPHMLHSIWGTAYAGMWVHLDAEHAGLVPATTRLLLALGVIPAALAALGIALSLRIAWRDPDANVDATLLVLTLVGLVAFVAFAFRVPTFAALKATYLLNLSAAWAFFLARAIAHLSTLGTSRYWRIAAVAGVSVPSLAAALAYAQAPGAPREEPVQMAPVRAHFGDWDGAGAIYRRELAEALEPGDRDAPRRNPFWLMDMIAATELRSGEALAAYAVYDESFRQRPHDSTQGAVLGRGSPYLANRLAVSAALAGETARARELLDAALVAARADRPLPELLVNRAALRTIAGDLAGAESDLRNALAAQPGLAPALHGRAWILHRRGDPGAAEMLDEARRAATRAPRGYPYGAGDGRGLNTQRFMLVLEDDGLALYRPARARGEDPHSK